MERCEFSRILNLMSPETQMRAHHLDACLEECEALSKRLKILSIQSLHADFRISQESDECTYRIHGTIHAELHQESVITLKPVPQSIRTPFHVKIRIAPDDENDFACTPYSAPTHIMDTSDDDDFESISSSHIDVGELITQYLALSLDPYPKNDGEVFEKSHTDHDALQHPVTPHNHPFSALERLKNSSNAEDN